MNITSKLIVAASLLSSSAFAGEWTVDPSHTSTTFAVKHMMVSTTKGAFDKVSGTVVGDDADFTKAQVNVTIDVNSINTREAKRDAHLKSADFFDAAKFPTITFKSTKIVAKGGGKYDLTGDLTMHGVTKPVTLSVESLTAPTPTPFNTTVRGVNAIGKVSRKDFGIGSANPAVGDEVKLEIDAELVAKAAAPAAAPAPAAKK